MTTRISIKVRLAWSTSAQMGLMLLEIGLGYYDVAMVHLLAHSVYKAQAFLSVSEVNYISQPEARSLPRLITVFVLFQVLLLTASYLLLGHAKWVPSALMAMALTTIWTNLSYFGVRVALSLLIVISYIALTFLAGLLIQPVTPILQLELALAVVLNLFAIAYWLIHHTPEKRLSQKWFISLNAGLYLDEWLTRCVLWLWPSHPIHYYQQLSKVPAETAMDKQTSSIQD